MNTNPEIDLGGQVNVPSDGGLGGSDDSRAWWEMRT